MKYISLSIVFFLISCSFYDYNIESMPYSERLYSDLPLDVQRYLSEQSSTLRMTNGIDSDIMLVDKNDSSAYRLEYVKTIIGPWTKCMKLINTKKDIVYKIERGTPSPFILHKKKLYIPNDFIMFVDDDYKFARYNEYILE